MEVLIACLPECACACNLLCIDVFIRQVVGDWQSSSVHFWDFTALSHLFYAFRSGEVDIFFCALVASVSLWYSMNWILKFPVPAFLFLKPSGQGLPHYQCNNQREGLCFLCGQLWLVWGVSCNLFAPGNLELGKWAAQPAFSWIWEWFFVCLPCPTYFFFHPGSVTALRNLARRGWGILCAFHMKWVHVGVWVWACPGGKFINTTRDNGLGNILKHPAPLN